VNDDMAAATILAGAITLLFALVGPHLAGKLPPATATRLLVPACWSTSGRTPSLRPVAPKRCHRTAPRGATSMPATPRP
jgi:hypothetical protein